MGMNVMLWRRDCPYPNLTVAPTLSRRRERGQRGTARSLSRTRERVRVGRRIASVVPT